MKIYSLLFLVMIFQYTYAPFLKISNKSSIEIIYEQKIKTELTIDSLDISLLKQLRMLKYFKKSDRSEVRKVCSELGITTKQLYTIIYIESSGNKKAKNPKTNAVGLIQFIPIVAKELGTSTNDLLKMSNKQQLYYVKKYLLLKSKGKKYNDCNTTLYLAILYPRAMYKNNNYIIGAKNSKVANGNIGLDYTNDSILTVEDINLYISTFI